MDSDHLDHPQQIVLLAEAGGTIIGNVSFENGPCRRIAHRGTLGIAVVKEWRGRGVGTALLETLLAWATTETLIEKVGLEVFTTNAEAIRLYRKLGFVEEGLRLKTSSSGLDGTRTRWRDISISSLPTGTTNTPSRKPKT